MTAGVRIAALIAYDGRVNIARNQDRRRRCGPQNSNVLLERFIRNASHLGQEAAAPSSGLRQEPRLLRGLVSKLGPYVRD